MPTSDAPTPTPPAGAPDPEVERIMELVDDYLTAEYEGTRLEMQAAEVALRDGVTAALARPPLGSREGAALRRVVKNVTDARLTAHYAVLNDMDDAVKVIYAIDTALMYDITDEDLALLRALTERGA